MKKRESLESTEGGGCDEVVIIRLILNSVVSPHEVNSVASNQPRDHVIRAG